MARPLGRNVRGSLRIPLLVLHSIATVVLVNIGFDLFEDWRKAVTRDFTEHWPRFLLAGLVFVLAGLVAGLALLQRRINRRFSWRSAAAFGIVPLVLALSLPTATWNWPAVGLNSPLGDFRSQFGSASHASIAWLLVGLAIAIGLASKDDR